VCYLLLTAKCLSGIRALQPCLQLEPPGLQLLAVFYLRQGWKPLHSLPCERSRSIPMAKSAVEVSLQQKALIPL
jgi:hypothetical protein